MIDTMMKTKKTKIIASIGPVTRSEEKIIELYNAGVNVIRVNFSHADYENAARITEIVHRNNKAGKTKLTLLGDLKGPEIRTGDYEGTKKYTKGEIFRIRIDALKVSGQDQFCDYPFFVEDIQVGDVIKIESGIFDVLIKEKYDDYVVVEALHDTEIKQRRHINLPTIKLKLPGLIAQDIENVIFCTQHGFDYIAMSFVRNAAHINDLRKLLDNNNGKHIGIISKVENQEGLNNIEEIVETSDGVMIARGDLGIEIPIETIPLRQQKIIAMCREKGKISIVATQMIESMMTSPFPTRAEVSDIFTAVTQKCDAIMLSGETAAGKYPIEAVQMMRKIAVQAESVIEYNHEEFEDHGFTDSDKIKKYMIKSAIEISENYPIAAIIIFTKTSKLAKIAAAYRPKVKVFAFTNRETSFTTMGLLFAIRSKFLPFTHHSEAMADSLKMLYEKHDVTMEDKVIVVTDLVEGGHEIPTMEIVTVKNIL